MAKDFYKILNITDEEKKLQGDDFNKVLKTKYRSIAKQWHPDRCKDESKKVEYEEKFKEASEAYAVLSDPEKKAQYDNPTSGGANFDFSGGFGGMDMSDIFREFGFGGFNPFGGERGRQQKQVVKGQSMRISLELSLEDIFNGVTKMIKYKRYDRCPTCGGNGKTANSREETCPVCGGTGTEFKNIGGWQQISTCGRCGGSGTILSNPCPNCGGNGVSSTTVETEINIPKGVEEGFQLVINGGGHAPKRCEGVNGDLYVLIREKEHEKFTRRGNDLYFKLDVSVVDAMLGCTKEVKTIDGKTLSTKLPQGVEENARIRFSGKGLPMYEHENIRGDMYGVVHIVMPKTLTSEEKEILNNLKTHQNFR